MLYQTTFVIPVIFLLDINAVTVDYHLNSVRIYSKIKTNKGICTQIIPQFQTSCQIGLEESIT